MATCCCCRFVNDVKPRPFDASDIYQQVEIIHKKHGRFTATSVAADGNPPLFLRRKYWEVQMSSTRRYQLDEAPGLNTSLRSRLPDLDLSVSRESSEAVVVGKWYCPFTLVKEGSVKLKDQMKMSTFYEVKLEQRWDKVFGFDNAGNEDRKAVEIDAVVETEKVFVEGRRAVWEERSSENGEIWFRLSFDGVEGRDDGLELSTKVMERLKWEQKRAGWVDGSEKQVRIKRREEFEGSSTDWTKFGCYVLVERFVFKRMDQSIALSYDFKHTHQIRCKWE